MKLTPIREIGSSRTGELRTSFETILEKVGKDNVTDIDDGDKVKASWAFKDNKGRKAFIWCYKYPTPQSCFCWSVDGDLDLIKEIFGADLVD